MAETNPTLQSTVLQIPTTVKSLIEALIFGAREPLGVREIQAMYEDQGSLGSEHRKISFEDIAKIIEDLNGEYSSVDRPYRIIQIAGGYQFATVPAYAEWLGKLYKEQARRKLSQSSIETLAIIAYKQPITKPELESIRGVNCDYVIKTLLEKDLATIVGRASTVGRPLLYGTSKEFLKHFGLNELNDLPRPREIQEILGDGQFETERRMLEAQQGLGEKKEEEFKSRLPHIPKRKPELDDDVKILPKKHAREIKLRPSEESGSAHPSEESSPGDATIPAPSQEQIPFVDDVVRPAGPDVPIIENEEIPSQPEPESESLEKVESSAPPEQVRYLSLAQQTPIEEEEPQIPQPTPEESVALDGSPEMATSELATEEAIPPPEEQPVAAVENQVTELPQVEEPQADSQEVQQTMADEQEPIVEGPVVQSESVAESPVILRPAVTEPEGERIPEPVTTPVVEHLESTSTSAFEPLPEAAQVQQAGSQHKTRWKTWKEKIQGFIKKLFG